MIRKHTSRRHIEESLFKLLMQVSFGVILAGLAYILFTILVKGLPAINLEILTQTPQGGYYLGKEGGILNAIIGSLYLAIGGTFLAVLIGIPLALFMKVYGHRSRLASVVRLTMDVLWGVPSIVYGAFGFMLMLLVGLRSSLLGGIIALALVELPILTRAVDEVIQMIPEDIEQASYALGTTRLETAMHIITRQMLPGIITALLLAFGRGIGDAAAVLFTAGYTDRIPTSLLQPVGSLPLAVFFQLNTPYPEVQSRAYAAALVLTVIVLVTSLGARWLSAHFSKYVVKS
jgi:phosphate transport system permease protein